MIGCFQQDDVCLGQIHVVKVFGQHQPDQLGKRARRLNAGGAAAHDHEGQQGAALAVVRLVAGQLKHSEQVIAGRDGAADVFHLVGVFLHGLETEKVGLPAHGQDQIVIRGHRAVHLHETRVKSTAVTSPMRNVRLR